MALKGNAFVKFIEESSAYEAFTYQFTFISISYSLCRTCYTETIQDCTLRVNFALVRSFHCLVLTLIGPFAEEDQVCPQQAALRE